MVEYETDNVIDHYEVLVGVPQGSILDRMARGL